MKYYRQTETYSLYREEIYIQSIELDENGEIIPISAFFVVYMNNNDIEDFYPIHIGNELKKLKNLEEITKEEFDRVLKEGEELKDILLQNPEIAELESAKDKIYRSMFDMSDEKY